MIDPNISPGENTSPQETASTRNSLLRRVFAEPIGRLVSSLDKNLPNVKADHITLLGLGLVAAADTAILIDPDKSVAPTVAYTVGSLLDGIDGSLERKKHTNNDLDSAIIGMQKDVIADKFEEIFTFSVLSYTSRKRGNRFAADCYALATMTTVLPALARARAESHGLIVTEGGIGTRVGRAFLGGVGMALNKQRVVSAAISSGVAINNLNTTRTRWTVLKDGNEASCLKGSDNDKNFKQAAKTRENTLLPLAAVGLVVGTALLKVKPKLS